MLQYLSSFELQHLLTYNRMVGSYELIHNCYEVLLKNVIKLLGTMIIELRLCLIYNFNELPW